MSASPDAGHTPPPRQPAFARILITTSSYVNALAKGASICLFLGMLAVVLVQVMARYLLSSPPSWTDEAARYLMVWVALLGATVAFHDAKDPTMIGPEVAARFVGRELARAVRTAAVLVFAVPVVMFSPEWLIRQSDRTTETLGVSLPLVLLIVPLSFGVVLLHAVAALIGETRDAASDDDSPTADRGRHLGV